MNTHEKNTLKQETKRKYWILRFGNGLYQLKYDKRKALVVVGYAVLALAIWIFRDNIFQLNNQDIFSLVFMGALNFMLPFWLIIGLVALIIFFGTPFGAKQINDNLWRIGLINHAGESPFLIRKTTDQHRTRMSALEFVSNGIPIDIWRDKQSKIETALNIYIANIERGKNSKRIIVYCVSGNMLLPKIIYWQDKYLSDKNFELVLGESVHGYETVDLSKIPHMLLGGSTGSGKSVLLKLLIMQCIKKGATVFIADFKGGVDFSSVWHSKCRIITDEKALLATLENLVIALEERKGHLLKSGCANIDEFNEKSDFTLPRMIFACDEVAEMLDRTGATKEQKDVVSQIEGKLSIIARQGRAFGIHLILATQRPDANILTGQIKNNVDFRVCGRADNVLSQIILDNTNAADQIPKSAQGRFITHNDTVFQGYLFDETACFDEKRSSESDN